MKLKIFFLAGFLAVFFPESKTVVLNPDQNIYHIEKNISYLIDKKEIYSLGDIRSGRLGSDFKKHKAEPLNFGYSSSVFWIRIIITNNRYVGRKWFLEAGYPLLDDITFFFPDGDGYSKLHAGDIYPFRQRPVKNRNFIFPFELASGESAAYYLRVKTTSSVHIPLKVMNQNSFNKQQQNKMLLYGIIYGALFILILYNLIILFISRKKLYLYYVVHVLAFLLSLAALDGFAFQFLWPQSTWWANFGISVFFSLTALSLIIFCIFFLNTRQNFPRLYKAALLLCLLPLFNLAGIVFLPYSFLIKINIFNGLLIPLFVLITAFFTFRKGFYPAVYHIFGWLFFIAGMFSYALSLMGIISQSFIMFYGLHLAAVIDILLLSFGLRSQLNFFTRQKIRSLEEARHIENRYLTLIENSNEIIFTMDHNKNILSVNKAIKDHLQIRQEDVIGTKFTDLIYYGDDGRSELARAIILQEIENFLKNDKPVSFVTSFKTPVLKEPVEFSVNLKYITTAAKKEILGSAVKVTDDKMLQFLERESSAYAIDNMMTTAEEFIYFITKNLRRYLNKNELTNVRIGLRELLINAIEHGNLNVTFEDKTRAQQEDSYFQLLAERRNDERYRERKVHIQYDLNPERVRYVITDQGQGFDHKKRTDLTAKEPSPEDMLLQHGRGIMIAGSTFSSVTYNDKGNQVEIVKKFA